ncbi:MAG: hypothetical protein WCO19_02785 [Candidatus Saccharibacteria bacterium]
MTEQLQYQPIPTTEVVSKPELGISLVDINAQVDIMAQSYPSVEEFSHPELAPAISELVNEFSINPTFFEGEDAQARLVILSSFAFRYATLDKTDPKASNVREKEFIANGVYALAKDYTDAFDDIKKQTEVEAGHSRSEGNTTAVIDRYTQPDLTHDLTEKINNGMFDGVKSRMGITNDNEDPYEVHVLSITDGSDTHGVGRKISEDRWPTAEEYRDDPVAANLKYDDSTYDLDASRSWLKGLEKRTESFINETGSNAVAAAFVVKNKNRTLLNVSAGYAEKIAYDNDLENRHEYYSENDLIRDSSIALHEYVHTQGGLATEGVFFGINLEERRAEYFAGDMQGYQDVKFFFNDLKLATGFDVLEYFDSHVKGGVKEDIYADIASVVGLDLLPDILTAAPGVYLSNQSGSIHNEIADYTGGFSGVIGRILEKSKTDPALVAEIDKRVEQSAQKLANSTVSDFEFVRSYRKSFGSDHFTDTLFDRVEAIRAERNTK